MRLIDAQLSDWARLYEWRNDDLMRKMARDHRRIPIKEHWSWIERTLTDGHSLLYIGIRECDDVKVGFVRFDIHDGFAEVAIAVGREFRGHGIGADMLALGIDRASRVGIALVAAEIDQINYPSLRMFANLGFKPVKFSSRFVTVERKC